MIDPLEKGHSQSCLGSPARFSDQRPRALQSGGSSSIWMFSRNLSGRQTALKILHAEKH